MQEADTAGALNEAAWDDLAARLDNAFPRLDPVGRLQLLARHVPGPLVLTTSFGLEDQALTHLVATAWIDATIVTLDTGRMFPETYTVWAATEARYGIRIKGFHPRATEIEALVERQGINGFYASQDARKACCHVRKVAPLRRALAGAQAWLTGLRADQSQHRQALAFVSFDAGQAMLKANPILDWSRERVADLVNDADIPVNPLHDKGFLSIGCAPCTRAVAPGEHERAGRWWWEQDGQQECGLHLSADGRLVRGRSG